MASNSVPNDALPALECQRHLFRLPARPVYLNCASRSPMLEEVERVGHAAVSQKIEPWRISDDGVHERVRALFAQVLGVAADFVALTPSTSYAISMAAHNILRLGRIGPGDAVVLLENQMSSNVYPWQRLCHEASAHISTVLHPADGLWTEAIEGHVRSLRARGVRVAVVAVPHFLWTDGSGPVDLLRIGALCDAESQHAVLVVDATQSLGAVPLSPDELRHVDWLACSVHKWLFGPYGLSCVYASPQWCAQSRSEPLVFDEHPRIGADGDKLLAFDPVQGYPEDFQPGARRFDAGGRPNPILFPMVEAALKQLLAWRPSRIGSYAAGLTARIEAGARRLELSVPAHHAPHFLGVGPGTSDIPSDAVGAAVVEAREHWAEEASAFLKTRGVIVSPRVGVLRVAVNVYNTTEEIDIFLGALKEFVHIHRRRSSL